MSVDQIPTCGELTAVAPPPTRTGPHTGSAPLWVIRLAKARANPGTWFLLDGEWARSTATHISQGVFKGVEPGEFESTSRAGEAPGRVRVYVRYVGGAA